jgi:hypothetical protein
MSGRRLEVSVVRLETAHLASDLRTRIVALAEPIGRVLRSAGHQYTSEPVHVFSLVSTAELSLDLGSTAETFYGRQAELKCGGKTVGWAIEVVPPVEDATARVLGPAI